MSAPRTNPRTPRLDELGLATTTEDGVLFTTGRAVAFQFVRNLEKSPNMGATYGQDLEPHGRYLLHRADTTGAAPRGWETGWVAFASPLVIRLTDDPENIYGPTGWKARLSRHYRATGAALARALTRAGFDGVVTVDDAGTTREIVDLHAFMPKRNPVVGKHPDLFVDGETPVLVALDDLTSEQIRALPRKAFTNEEWEQLDEDDQEAIEESDEDSQARVDALADVFIRRYEWEQNEPSRDFSGMEESFEYYLREHADRLYEEIPARAMDIIDRRARELGLTEEQKRAACNEYLADTNHYEFASSVRGRATAFYTENIQGNVYVERDDFEEQYKACFPDEVDRACKKIEADTDHTINPDREDFEKKVAEKYGTFEWYWETGNTVSGWINWTDAAEAIGEALAEVEVPDDQDLPGAPPPAERVVYRWPDGFYVQDLLPSELAAEGAAMGMCVGRPDMGYGRAVRDGEIKILSLRRPSGKPLFTIEVVLGNGVRGRPRFVGAVKEDFIEQIKGKANRVPGFDLGKDGVFGETPLAATLRAAIKRDEVQRVLEYVASTGIPATDVEDLAAAIRTITELRRANDPWAEKMARLILLTPDDAEAAAEPKENPAMPTCSTHGADCGGFCSPYKSRAARANPAAPAIVTAYHGTRRASVILAEGFKPSTGGEFGPGIYFSENPDTAEWYAQHVSTGDEAPTVLTTTVDISKFFTVRKVDWIQRTQRRTPRTVQAELRRQGYVGIIGIAINDHERQIVAFDTSPIVEPVRAKSNPFGRSREFKFESTQPVLDAIESAEPSHEFLPAGGNFEPVDPERFSGDPLYRVRKVTWVASEGYLVRIPVENILFMEGNQWGFEHAAGLLEGILDGSNTMLEAPAGRVHRITAADVKQTEKYEKAGELSYQMSMTSPWTKADIGSYYAQLVDGNHRAAAAILAGEPYIYVYVAENSRENVRKKDFE